MKPSKGSYKPFNGWLRERFQLHKLVEIIWQSSDPNFALLFNRVQEGQQTNDDLIQINVFASTNTATWPGEYVKIYLNNYLPGKENDNSIHKLDSGIVFFKLKIVKKILKQIHGP